jgi:hypothetical protein
MADQNKRGLRRLALVGIFVILLPLVVSGCQKYPRTKAGGANQAGSSSGKSPAGPAPKGRSGTGG